MRSYNEYSSTRGYCNSTKPVPIINPVTLQIVVDNDDSLQGEHPLTGQTMGFDGTNVVWGDFGGGTTPSLQQVMDVGSTATVSTPIELKTTGANSITVESSRSILLKSNTALDITSTVGDINLTANGINGFINLDANKDIDITSTSGDIVLTTTSGMTTVKGSNEITFEPNTNPKITITGTTANTITETGYTTKEKNDDVTYYLNFSDNYIDGISPICKTAGISCNPNDNSITATTFIGDVSGTITNSDNVWNAGLTASAQYSLAYFEDNTAGTYSQLSSDTTANRLYYNPSNNHLTISNGTNTNQMSGDGYTTKEKNDAGPYYLNFSRNYTDTVAAICKTSGISCDPSANSITATTFIGNLSGGATTVETTSDNSNGQYFIPFSQTTAGPNTQLYLDDSTNFTYNPFTTTIKASDGTNTDTISPTVITLSDGVSTTNDIRAQNITLGDGVNTDTISPATITLTDANNNTNTITNTSVSIIGNSNGNVGIVLGDTLAGTATATAGFNATPAVNAILGLSCGDTGTSPPTGTASLSTTTTTARLDLGYSGQFTTTKSVVMDLDGMAFQGSPNYNIVGGGSLKIDSALTTIESDTNLLLNSGSGSKVLINSDGTNPNQVSLTKSEIRISDSGDPTGNVYSNMYSNQISVQGINPLPIQTYMGWASGFTTSDSNLAQSTAYQTNRTTTNKNYTIQNTGAVGSADLTVTTTNGNLTVNAGKTLTLNGSDTDGTGKGISIPKTTPNLYYELNTGSPFDRLTIDNNGTITTASITNQAITDIAPNGIILQKPDVNKSLEIGSDSGLFFKTSGVNQSFYTPTSFQIQNSATGVLTSTNLTSYQMSAISPTDQTGVNTDGFITTKNSGGKVELKSVGQVEVLGTGVGYTTTPEIFLRNTLATAGNTVGVPSIESYKEGRNVVQNDVIYSQQFNAKNYLGGKTTFGKIECVATNSSAPAGDDGALDFYTAVNGVTSLVMRFNGADNENNSFRPFDLNGNNLKTSTGSMSIDTSSSSTAGATLTLATKAGTAGSGAGLVMTGNTLTSTTAGSNAGQHLCLTLPDAVTGLPRVFKIQLLNP